MISNDAHENVLGKSLEALLAELGAPMKENAFELGANVSEFRIELTNFFDEDRRRTDPPMIKELTWASAENHRVTVWFSQSEGGWNALHLLKWHSDDQF